MPFFRSPATEENRTASALLAALDAAHPLPFSGYLQELKAGASPAQVGAEVGRALAQRERLYARAIQDKERWRQQAESYRTAWQNAQRTDELREARLRIEGLESLLAQEKASAERSQRRAIYLENEKRRLEALVREQNEIIAEQRLQLAEWDAQDI